MVVVALVGAAVALGGDDDADAPVAAFDGIERWSTETGLTGDRAAIVGQDDDTIVVAAETDCADCDTVELVAIDRATGELLWTRTVDLGTTRQLFTYTVRLADGRALWTEARDTERDQNDLVAHDARTGAELWRTRADVDGFGGWIPWGDLELLHQRRDDAPDRIVVIDNATGAERWSVEPEGAEPLVSLGGVFAETVVIGVGDRAAWSDDDRPVTYTAYDRSGAERWQTGGTFGLSRELDSSADPDVVLIEDGDDLVGVGASDGDERWRSPGVAGLDSDGRLLTDPTSPHLVSCRIADDDAWTEVGVYDRATGSERWSARTEATSEGLGAAGPVAATADALIVSSGGSHCSWGGFGDQGLTLSALAWDDGHEVWSRRSASDAFTAFTELRGLGDATSIVTRPGTDVTLAELERGRSSILDPASGEIAARTSDGRLFRVGAGFAVLERTEAGVEVSPYDGGASIHLDDAQAELLAFVDGVLYLLQEDGLMVAID